MQALLDVYEHVEIVGTYELSGDITVPANRKLSGGTLKITGQLSGAIHSNHPDLRRAFTFTAGDATVDGVEFVGENALFDGQYVQNQNSVLWFPHGSTFNHIKITNCTFRNLYGFPLNGSILVNTCFIADNVAIECGNGFNISCRGVQYLRNQLTDAEGIECAGKFAGIEDNEVDGGFGISAGGNTVPGVYVDSQVIRGNIIRNTKTGIAIAEMSKDTIVEGNTIEYVETGIIVATPMQGTWTENVTIRGNTIRHVHESVPNTAGSGLSLGGETTGILAEDNVIEDAKVGAYVGADGVTMRRNYLRGTFRDLHIAAGVTEYILEDNDYITSNM